MTRVVASAPHFYVRDLEWAIRFYVDVLGFREPKRWGEPPNFAMPDRNGHIVMLALVIDKPINAHGEQGHWDAYFWCDEIDTLWEAIKDHPDLVHGPEDRDYYGMREIGIRDPDGHFLVFAEEMDEEDEE